jgi:DNA-directed RNA polymerase specialized sigma subunit
MGENMTSGVYLSEEEKEDIRKAYFEDQKFKNQIATEKGISTSAVQKILKESNSNKSI